MDVLLTHGPPANHGGLIRWDNSDVGCEELYEAAKRIKPKVHVFGHVHEGRYPPHTHALSHKHVYTYKHTPPTNAHVCTAHKRALTDTLRTSAHMYSHECDN